MFRWLVLSTCLLIGNGIANDSQHKQNGWIIQTLDGYDVENVIRGSVKSEQLRQSLEFKKISSDENIYHISYQDINVSLLKSHPGIVAVEPNLKLENRNTEPNDSRYGDQWPLQKINAPKAWDFTTGGSTAEGDEITIAIFDEGVDLSHPELADNIWINNEEVPGDGQDNDENGYVDDVKGMNVVTGKDDHDPHSHGTAIAGIMGAQSNNSTGIAGINWNIKMMVLSKSGSSSIFIDELYTMYEYVIDQRTKYNETNGARGSYVVACNASLGITGRDPEEFPIWCTYFDRFGALGILYANATTNQEWDVDTKHDMPISCASNYIIGVTNTNETDLREESGFGKLTIDLASPGQGSISTRPNAGYGTFSGTSAACPHVAGAVALLHAYPCEEFAAFLKNSPGTGALELKKIILDNVDSLAHLTEKTVSGGRLNLYKPMLAIREKYCNYQAGDKLKITKIIPTVIDHSIRFEFSNPHPEEIDILISDILGREIYRDVIKPSDPGIKEIDLPSGIQTGGVYLLTIRKGKTIHTKKFIYM